MTTREENEREYKAIDQMLTMHAVLRDRLRRRAFVLNTLLLAASLIIAVFSFLPDESFQKLNLDAGQVRLIVGWSAVVVIIIAVTEYRVNWDNIAGLHGEAARRLAELKALYRKSFSSTGGEVENSNSELTKQYGKIVDALPPIPDRLFNNLKAHHKFKRQVSEMISRFPKTPIWLIKLVVRIEGVRDILRGNKR